MKSHARLVAVTLCGLIAVIVALLLLATPTTVGEPITEFPISTDEIAAPAAPPVVFLHDPAWPPYAQTEIIVFPDPPIARQPTEICVWVVNTSGVSQTVAVDLAFANFGIGLPFTPIGSRPNVIVPPLGRVKVCLHWIPPAEGHWCLQAVLHQAGEADLISQRNIDIWERLLPGVPAITEFLVRNPLTEVLPIHLELKRNPVRQDWGMSLSPTDFDLQPDGQMLATLIITPPVGAKLGTRDFIADVEATAMTVPTPTLIGGFRKLDWPRVPLHRMQDPPYAESEITIEPYPPLAGEPTRICVDLRNISDEPQTVDVEFAIANFGIGLPFTPIDHQLITIPPHGTIRVCTMWVPPQAGHFCVQIRLIDPQGLYVEQISQRNMDVSEFLVPNQPDQLILPVRNPFAFMTDISLTVASFLPEWQVDLSSDVLLAVPSGATRPVTVTVVPGPGPLPEDGRPVADIEAWGFVDQPQPHWELIGGVRKVYRPPVPIHQPGDPPYAEREITIDPYPPRAGEPTQICVELRNPTNVTQTVEVEFAIANFGIGLPFTPIHGQTVTLPPHSSVKKCVTWVPPFAGHFCVQIRLVDPQQRYVDQVSQRNIDVGEVFVPGQWTEPFVFPVGNPFDQPTNIEVAAIPHLPEWQVSLTPTLLLDVPPHETRPVTLTVRPPVGRPFPEDDTPIVDVEAHAQGDLIGGFRKIYRPPIPIHPPGDPIYAESEIHITPYPPNAGQPTEICTEVRNPTNVTQTFTVTFSVANFGIGLPFHPINTRVITLLPHSTGMVCVMWVPPFAGHFCAQITIVQPGHEPVWSQRNMDVGEIFRPGQPSTLVFPVGNPTTQPATVTLGLVPHVEGWGIELSRDVLPNLAPNAVRWVTLTVTPPLNQPFPPPDAPVVDVEAYIGRELIGGFRKLFHPPVPVHPPKDPVYAESEIFIDPYPVWLNRPTVIGTFVFNPTDFAQQVTVTFGVAHFGIGMPFTQTGILTPTMVVTIPPHGQARVQTIWIAQYQGHACVQIKLQSAGHEPVYSQRNIDVGEPLNPDRPHTRIVEVRNPTNRVVTITLGLINHRPDWQVSITPTLLTNVGPGVVREVLLTVKPPTWEGLADERPIADVEAYIDGKLIGGIRKIAMPPVPIHKPQDRPYAETEISVTPYPLQAGKPATITTDIVNTSEVTQAIRVEFWVANFGFGIPFTNTNIVPPYRVITLTPGMSQTVSAVWTPPSPGNWCIQIRLRDPNNQYPDQISQRNVHVERREWQPCVPFTKDFWLQNSTPLTVTVSIGMNAINLPPGWTYSTNITQTVLGPYQGITVTLTITPPCGLSKATWLTPLGTLDTGGASGPATIDVEGYVDGELLGGIEVQFEAALPWRIYLSIVRK